MSQLESEVLRSGKPALVKIGAKWCSACSRAKKPLEKISNDPQLEGIIFAVVDADVSPDISKKYAVTGLPTWIYLDKDGKKFHQEAGFSENLRNDVIAKFAGMTSGASSAAATPEKKTQEEVAPQVTQTAPQEEQQLAVTEEAASESGTCAAAEESFFTRAYNSVTGFFTSIFDTVRGWFR